MALRTICLPFLAFLLLTCHVKMAFSAAGTNSTEPATATAATATDKTPLISDSSVASSLAVALGSIVSALWNCWTGRKTRKEILEQRKTLAKVEEDLARENREREEERTLRSVFSMYSKPLALAGFELQSRLYTILEMPLLYKMCAKGEGEAEVDQTKKDYAIYHTMFLFGEFLAWMEIIRRKMQGFKLMTHDFVALWRCDCGWEGSGYHDYEDHSSNFEKRLCGIRFGAHRIVIVWKCKSCSWEGHSFEQAEAHQDAMRHFAKLMYLCKEPGCKFKGSASEEGFKKHSSKHECREIWHCSGCGWQEKCDANERGLPSVTCPQAGDPRSLNNLMDSVAFQFSGDTPIQRGLQNDDDPASSSSLAQNKKSNLVDDEDLFQMLAGVQREIGEVMMKAWDQQSSQKDGLPESAFRVLGYSEFLQKIALADSPIERAFRKLKENLELLAEQKKPVRHRITILQHVIIRLVKEIDNKFEFIKKGRLKPILFICSHCEHNHEGADEEIKEGEHPRSLDLKKPECRRCSCSRPSYFKQAKYEAELEKDTGHMPEGGSAEKASSGGDKVASNSETPGAQTRSAHVIDVACDGYELNLPGQTGR